MKKQKLDTISYDVFKKKKDDAIRNQPLRKKIYLSEIKLIDDEHIDLDGKALQITDLAFDDFRAMLKIPVAFMNRFEKTFTEEGKRQFFNRLKDAQAAKSGETITLIANPHEKKLLRILNKNKGGISNEGFIQYAERLIDQWDLKVTNFIVTMDGEFCIDTVSPAHLTEIHDLNDEEFYPGISLQNTLNYGGEICPYIYRLICGNGLTAREFEEKFRMHDLTLKNIQKFNSQMIHFYRSGLIPQGYINKVYLATRTMASVFEMIQAESLLLTKTNIDHHEVQKFIKSEEVYNRYENYGIMSTSEMSTLQMRNAPTNMSIWDVVNALTRFASHDLGYHVPEQRKMHITSAAGKMLLKKSFDMENRIPSPFKN